MKTSALIVDINSKDGVIARASMRVNKKGEATIVTDKFNGDNNGQIALLNGFAKVLGQLNETEFTGRASFILPEAVALRLMGAVKEVKDGGDAYEKLFLGWMAKSSDAEKYSEAISAVVEQIEAFLSVEENSLNIVNARALYRYELVGDGVANVNAGDKITLKDSVNEALKVSAKAENNYLNGEFTATTQTIKDREGNSRVRAFVNRIYKYEVNGERKASTASELLAFMDENPKVELSGTESTNAAISALKLRKINAEQLPRILVAKIQTVATAKDGALF